MKKNLWNLVKPPADGENVATWAATAQAQSKDEQALGIILTALDEQALGIILTALDDSYIHFLDDATSSFEAWQTLERMFGIKAKHSKISLKMQVYGLIMQPNEDLGSLINRLKSMCTQLVYVKAPLDEEDKVAVLLNSLPQMYD